MRHKPKEGATDYAYIWVGQRGDLAQETQASSAFVFSNYFAQGGLRAICVIIACDNHKRISRHLEQVQLIMGRVRGRNDPEESASRQKMT